MDKSFSLLVGGILVLPSLIAFFSIVETLFQAVVKDCKEIAESSTSRAFWLGVVNSIFIVVLIRLFFFLGEQTGIPLLILPGAILAIAFLFGVILGFSAMIQLIGDRIFSNHSGFRKQIYAAGITILGCLTPYIGWFGLFPYLILVGFGAFVGRTFNEYRGNKQKKKKKK